MRTYSFPELTPQFVLGAHRAAVNAVSISSTLIVSGSGDRSIRLWDAKTGKLLRTFENHHSRGYVHCHRFPAHSCICTNPHNHRIASIDFKPPYVLSGSSDKHLRLFDITTLQGWSTSPDYQYEGTHPPASAPLPISFPFPTPTMGVGSTVCQVCGSANVQPAPKAAQEARCLHGDLVRSVALGEDFVLSGSYDLSIKVCWEISPSSGMGIFDIDIDSF